MATYRFEQVTVIVWLEFFVKISVALTNLRTFMRLMSSIRLAYERDDVLQWRTFREIYCCPISILNLQNDSKDQDADPRKFISSEKYVREELYRVEDLQRRGRGKRRVVER